MNTEIKKSKWKTWHKVVLGVVIAFFGMMAIAVNSDTANTQEPAKSEAKAEPVAEVKQSIAVTAAKLFADYAANEVAADEMYKGKRLEVSGVVESINKDFTEDVYVNLKVSDYEYVKCNMSKEAGKQAAGLSKGQRVTFIGEGATMIIGTPIVSDCTFK